LSLCCLQTRSPPNKLLMRCEVCDADGDLEMHHIRKLADLNQPGRRERPAWMHLMAKRRVVYL
jgi:hypothetical protein